MYRPYIDGLRALAVLLVFVFHLRPEWLPGGYLGVDVFFVISGFVISQSLYTEYQKTGTIRIGNFYIRRIKRLYPALVTMIMATTTAYFFFGFLWDTNLLIKSSITSILAVSNLYYLRQADNYFHQDLVNPLVHTWSLGVEEQFYFIFPLLLLGVLLMANRLRHNLLFVATTFLLITVVICVLFSVNADNAWGHFYSPIARFWELGAGCVLFFFSQAYSFRAMGHPAIAAGSVALLLGTVGLSSSIDNLQLETLLAVLATVGLIAAGLERTTAAIAVLSANLVVYFGKLSYSLYLWHLPTLYFFNLYAPSLWYYLLSPVVTVGLAMVSYHYIEQVFRHSEQFERLILRSLVVVPVVGLLIVVVFFGYFGLSGSSRAVNENLNTFSAAVEKINYLEQKAQLGERTSPTYTLEGVDVFTACTEQAGVVENLPEDCFRAGASSTLIYIAGDSHATHFLPMLEPVTELGDLYYETFPRRAIVNRKGAPVNTDAAISYTEQQLKGLASSYDEVYFMVSLYISPDRKQADLITANMKKLVEAIRPYSQIILVAPTPEFRVGPESCVASGVHCDLDMASDQARRQTVLDIYTALALEYAEVVVFDPSPEICATDTETCAIYVPETDLLRYRDTDHISFELSAALTPYFREWFEATY